MKRALFALLVLAMSGSALGGQPVPKGFGLDLDLISVGDNGRSATFEVNWFGPGYFRQFPSPGYVAYYYKNFGYAGICPSLDCDGGSKETS